MEVIAARALLFRNSDGCAKGVLRQGRFRWIALQQKVASKAMQEGDAKTDLALKSKSQGLIDASKSPL